MTCAICKFIWIDVKLGTQHATKIATCMCVHTSTSKILGHACSNISTKNIDKGEP